MSNRVFEVYARKEENGKDVIVQTVSCKRPSSLKSYKNLEKEFNSGKWFSYGWRVKENSPFVTS